MLKKGANPKEMIVHLQLHLLQWMERKSQLVWHRCDINMLFEWADTMESFQLRQNVEVK
uniref:Uncharacterized protein n=1 Tax=Physcomitrium patens TaxID=3218 RepID=A0A2K1J8A3_PHYPA|nr:hypothetical protein PHYPA_020858 [Physcomitrium patens]